MEPLTSPQKPRKKVMSDMVASSKPRTTSRIKKVALPIPEEQESFTEAVLYEEEIQPSRKKPSAPTTNRMGCSLWLVSAVCAVILALVLGGVFARAQIQVISKHFSGPVDISLTAGQSPQSALQFFTASHTFTSEETIPSTETALENRAATGVLRVTNSTNKPVTLLPATVFRSINPQNNTSLRYRTLTKITVPPAAITGSATVSVQALVPGSGGNVSEGEMVLEKPITGIRTSIMAPITGGVTIGDHTFAMADKEQVEARLAERLSNDQSLIKRMSESLPAHVIALPVSFIQPTPTFAQTYQAEGIKITGSRSVGLVLVDRKKFARLLGNKLDVAPEVLLDITDLQGLTVTTSALATPASFPQTLVLRITGSASVKGFVDYEKLKEYVLGKKRSEVKSFLGTLPELESFKVSTTPFWRSLIPVNPDEVTVSGQ